MLLRHVRHFPGSQSTHNTEVIAPVVKGHYSEEFNYPSGVGRIRKVQIARYDHQPQLCPSPTHPYQPSGGGNPDEDVVGESYCLC